jgi:hypothetical protein
MTTPAVAVDDELYEWQRGIPALLVALLAIAIFGYGYFVARPAVPEQYFLAGQQALVDIGVVEGQKEVSASEEDEDPLEALDKKFQVTNMYLRRLSAIEEHRDWAKYHTALVAESHAGFLLIKAGQALTKGEKRQVEKLFGQSLGESKKAENTMELLSKSDSLEANQAKVWLLAKKIAQPDSDSAKREELSSSAVELLGQNPKDELAKLCVAQADIRSGFDEDQTLSSTQRAEKLTRALDLLSSIKKATLLKFALQAEAYDAQDIPAAIEVASRAAQFQWSLSPIDQKSIDSVSLMTLSLVRAGSLQEAKTFLGTRLPTYPTISQKQLVELVEEGLWRMIVCRVAFPNETRPAKVADLMEFLCSLNPTADRLHDCMRQLSSDSLENDFINELRSQLVRQRTAPWTIFFVASQAALSDQWQESRALLQGVAQKQPSIAAYFSYYASRSGKENEERAGFASRFLEQLSREAPDNARIWIDRISFLIEQQQPEKALECLKILESKAQQTPFLLEYIEQLYRDMKETDRADAIRKRIDELAGSKKESKK